MAEIRRLPESELIVMQCVWNHEAPVARSVIEAELRETHPMAQTTVLTLISRLTEKGFLSVQKVGRSSAYTPLVSNQDYLASEGKRFFRSLCGGSIHAFAAALSDSGLSAEDIDELRRLMERGEL